MATYCITATYAAGTSANVSFPAGKTWEDVLDWYIKWDILHIQWKGTTGFVEFELNSDTLECIDWKHPADTRVYEVDEVSGDTDYDKEIASDETI